MDILLNIARTLLGIRADAVVIQLIQPSSGERRPPRRTGFLGQGSSGKLDWV
jgi:hypothetical protein